MARAREIEPLAKKLDPSDAKRPRPAEVRAARELLECALASGLAREEWSLSNAPGAPVIARRDGDELRPFGLAERVATDIDEARRVDALLASHGLSTRTLLAPD
ncbi:MAG: hypothetical protein IT453_20735 [Planctomycetes bacterium]|nr:hypothetical protein [Planctomycetota bacterium]